MDDHRRKLFYLLFSAWFAGALLIFILGTTKPSTNKLQPITPQNLLNACHPAIDDEICKFQKEKFQNFYFNHSQKIVIVVIDALRADFIPYIKSNAKFNSSMTFTETLLKNGSAISFVTRGSAPTVTLPRIKTLLTGTVSSFMDILLNFNADELVDDNILKQALSAGYRSVFYGDDTWLKLFPDLFVRSEGTHSFYVSDFKEVDYNVSRHILNETKSGDWNILIMHFLGLDHIGHSYGPFSEFLAPKLKEMDDIIKLIYEKIKVSADFPAYIIVCGDHGMTNAGSHGGTTDDELLTPLIFISTSNQKSNPKNASLIDQLDVAPTLSVILGLPIPANSYGRIIPDVLNFIGLTKEEILYCSYFNMLQISKVYNNIFPFKNENYSPLIKETVSNHYHWLKDHHSVNESYFTQLLKSYESLLSNMKFDLLSSLQDYSEVMMVVGFTCMWMACLPTTSVLLMSTCQRNLMVPLTLTDKVCLLFLLLHASSLLSSSFIEEEHQTWYFFASSFAIVMCFKRLYIFLTIVLINGKTVCNFRSFWLKSYPTIVCTLCFLVTHRVFRKWNQTGNKWQHLPDISDWLSQEHNIVYYGVAIVTSQLILVFYFCDKLTKFTWATFVSGLLMTTIQKFEDSGVLRSANRDSHPLKEWIPYLVYTISAFILIVGYIQIHLSSSPRGEKIKKFISQFIASWVLLTGIIARPYNLPLITIVFIQEFFVYRLVYTDTTFSFVSTVTCYFIMGISSFFYYGNSNSFSTIDIFTGYTGVYSYEPSIVGFLVICNIYSTFMLWMMMLFYRTMHLVANIERVIMSSKIIFLYILDYKKIILALYCNAVFLMRYHLFIYSVFLPKLFYEVSHFLFLNLLYLLIHFMFVKLL